MSREELLNNLRRVENIYSRFENTYNKITSNQMFQAQRSSMRISKRFTKILGYIIAAVVLVIPVIIIDSIFADIGLKIFPGWILYFVGIYYVGRWFGKKIIFVDGRLQWNLLGAYSFIHDYDVEGAIALAEKQCEEIRREYAQVDVSWYPPSYQTAHAAHFFYEAILNFRCETIGQAVNLYEDMLYKDESLRLQRQQVSLAFQQCILQEQTIATIMQESAATRATIMNEGAMTRAQNAGGFADVSGQLNGVSQTLNKIKKMF